MPYQPMPLQKRALPFDDPNFVFELKYDGFRALAVINRRPELVSRNGHPFASYAELAKQIAAHLPVNTVLDGEIVAVDRKGKPRFNDPLWPGILSVIACYRQHGCTIIRDANVFITITASMPSHRVVSVSLAVAIAAALGANCPAQEVATVDLTKVTARRELRRPEATQGESGVRGFTTEDNQGSCPLTFPGVPVNPDSNNNNMTGAVRTTLVSLDRTHYQVGDEPTFEVSVENVDSTPVRIPISPHLADLQPKDPARKFAYSELELVLWIAGKEGGASTGGGLNLYGADKNADTMLTLNLGEWVRIIGKGKIGFPPANGRTVWPIHPEAINRMYARVSLHRDETMLTATAGATVRRQVCLRQTYGRSFPIALTGAAE